MIETTSQVTDINITGEQSLDPVLAERVFSAARRGLLGLSADSEKQEAAGFEKIAQSAKIYMLLRAMTPEVQRQFFEQAAAFSEFLTKHEKIVCAHHIDADGLTSAVLLAHLVAVLTDKSVASVREKMRFVSINNGNRNLDPDQLEKVIALQSEGFTGLVFVDVSPRDTEQLSYLQQTGYSLANIDHHVVNDPAQPFDVRFNPSQITGLAPQLLDEMSTSALFGLFPRYLKSASWSNVDWLMQIGNMGDESMLTQVIELDVLVEGKPIYEKPLDDKQHEQLVEERTKRYSFAQFLNIVGATEQYNVTPVERDKYINRLLDQLFPYDLEGDSIEAQIVERVRNSQEFHERFEAIVGSMVETMAFLLSVAEVASARSEVLEEERQRAASEKGDRFISDESDLFKVIGENGLESLVVEAPSYRIVVHLIDTVGFTDGNMIVGGMIKPHLNQLEHQGMSRRLFNDTVSKPTTVILVQKQSDDIYQLGFYSADSKLTGSTDKNCGALIAKSNRLDLTKGGGHAKRGGADLKAAKLVSAIEFLLFEVITTLDAGTVKNALERNTNLDAFLQDFFAKALVNQVQAPISV